MKKISSIRLSGALLFGVTIAVLLTVARVGVAQSSKPSDNLNALAAAGNAANGERELRIVGCAGCHGQNAEGREGPPLLKTKLKFPAFDTWVRVASGGMFPFTPSMASDAQLADIYAFLQAGPKADGSQAEATVQYPANNGAPPGNAADGAAAFNSTGCASCHGDHAEGREGPALVNIQKTFLVFKYVVRNPEGGMPAEFPPELVSDKQLADIYAFVQPDPYADAPMGTAFGPANFSSSGDPDNGKILFTTKGCAKCHVTDRQATREDAQVNGVPSSLQGLIDFVRHPTGKMPPSTEAAVSDDELADIYAFMKFRPKP